MGPTFSIEVSPSPPFVIPSSQDNHHASASSCIFFNEDDDDDDDGGRGSLISNRIRPDKSLDDSSDSSSSIGAPDDSEEEEQEGEEEVDSAVSRKGALVSLDSLEDSLPIKRGLSNHFSGKSKSFANLSEMSCVNRVKDLEKPENPFNKRRRLIMANKWARKSSLYNWPNPKSMPLLALNEDEEEEAAASASASNEQEENQQSSPSSSSEQEGQNQRHKTPKISKLQERKLKSCLKSQSCFSLADLQEQEYQ